jgi:TonB-dependent SusC/RagA subfamily outer membrane receptor
VTTFKSILSKLRKQSGKDFFYNSSQVNEHQPLTLYINNKPWTQALEMLLAKQTLTNSIRGNNVLIQRKDADTENQTRTLSLQKQTLKGIVTNSTITPMAGVTVQLIGTTLDIATNDRGEFQFDQAPLSEELRINFIGYQERRISYQGSSLLQITLIEEVKTIDEVVLIGYGVQKKSDLTGAVSAVQAKDFTQGANTNALQLLNGKAPGVTISQTNSAPGAGTKIQVRGAGSINSSNDTLIVVDGLLSIDPSSLSPDDIESIDILKDASPAAIYGTRAASGVVLITTKKLNQV